MIETVYLVFHDGISPDSANRFMDFTTKVIGQYSPRTLYFLFSSGGGSVDSGVALFNFIKGLPQEVIMHNVGSIDSIANAVFLAGKRRYAAPTSSFLLHGVNWNFGQGATLSYTQMQETLSRFDAAEQQTAKIIGDCTKLSEAEVRALFLQGSSKSPQFALEKGMIHEIRDVSMTGGAPLHVISPVGGA